MHRGTFFAIVDGVDDDIKVWKSTEFNGGMGLDCDGKDAFEMLSKVKNIYDFRKMVIDFDEQHFQYKYEVTYYIADSESNPYVNADKSKGFEYSKTQEQLKFFYDDNGDYIYTSDSNYIKNLSTKNISIVCTNGVYVLKPNQILVADYSECINNSKQSFKENIEDVILEDLDSTIYIPTQKEKETLDKIIQVLGQLGFSASPYEQEGIYNTIEIESWTDDGVNMIHTLDFYDSCVDIYDPKKVEKELEKLADEFDIDDEIDTHRQSQEYRRIFSIRNSIEDFEAYQELLERAASNFMNQYKKIVDKDKQLEAEESKEEVDYV